MAGSTFVINERPIAITPGSLTTSGTGANFVQVGSNTPVQEVLINPASLAVDVSRNAGTSFFTIPANTPSIVDVIKNTNELYLRRNDQSNIANTYYLEFRQFSTPV